MYFPPCASCAPRRKQSVHCIACARESRSSDASSVFARILRFGLRFYNTLKPHRDLLYPPTHPFQLCSPKGRVMSWQASRAAGAHDPLPHPPRLPDSFVTLFFMRRQPPRASEPQNQRSFVCRCHRGAWCPTMQVRSMQTKIPPHAKPLRIQRRCFASIDLSARRSPLPTYFKELDLSPPPHDPPSASPVMRNV